MDGDKLSKEKRLAKCKSSKMNAEESIKDYIVLKEYHSKFGEGLRGNWYEYEWAMCGSFPVDEDFMRLPNNDVIQLEGRQQK